MASAKNAQNTLKKAEIEKGNGNYEACISLTTEVSRTAPLLASARLMRAQCHVARGEIDEAAGDFA